MDSEPGAPCRLVIIDDNQDAANLIAVLLRELGQDAYAAYDGPSGINLIHDCRPHVVLLDLVMPEVSGFDVLKAIRAAPDLAGTTIIALTGMSQPDEVSAALAAGFDGHIVKPASAEVLAEVVHRHAPDSPTSGRATPKHPFVSF